MSRISEIGRAVRDPNVLRNAAKDPRAALRKLRSPGPLPVLTEAQRASWQNHGFVVLPKFFGADRLANVNDELDTVWDDRGRTIAGSSSTCTSARVTNSGSGSGTRRTRVAWSPTS